MDAIPGGIREDNYVRYVLAPPLITTKVWSGDLLSASFPSSEAGKVIQCGAEIVVSRSSDDSCGVMDKIHPVPFEMIHEEWLISEGLAARGPLAN